MSDIIGLIPAAGKGERLGLPFPKELYPILDGDSYKPVAQFVLENMTEAGVTHVVMVVNETKHQLMKYFGSGARFGCDISYVYQDENKPGMVGAIDAAYPFTKDKIVFFGMADTIMRPENVFDRLHYSMQDWHGDGALALFPTTTPKKFGMVRMMEKYPYVREIVDKPAETDLIDMWGCMVWHAGLYRYICYQYQHGVRLYSDILNNAINQGLHLVGVRIPDGDYTDVGTWDEIRGMESGI